ncbi:MAG: hypothetical protein ACXVEE_43165, partial [Polyangiales bacterium]
MDRRAFLSTLAASVAGSAVLSATGSAAPRGVRMRWPWPVRMPDPHAANDLVSALLGVALFPPLYVRAIDGYIEPKLAMGAPKERKLGVRVDLQPYIRPSD